MPLARYTCTGWLVLLFLMSSQSQSPLTHVNPWLSACDLHSPTSVDLQGSCPTMISEFPGPPQCPSPCTSPNSDNTTQCLEYLNESHNTVLCGGDGGRAASRLHLRHCCEHTVRDALPGNFSDSDSCRRNVQALVEVDRLAARLECEFAEILTRYDCDQVYSVNSACSSCRVSTLFLHMVSPLWFVSCCVCVEDRTRFVTCYVGVEDHEPGSLVFLLLFT